jgi:Abortive infection alpha
MPDENKIRDVVDAVTGVAQAIPVYQDVVQPAAQEVGKALQTVAKTVHIALAPVSALVWGYDQIKDFVSTKVAERLKNVPPENITTPKPNVAGPALESLRYTGHESALSDMYANLLASAMNKETADGAHPAFVEIIRQLTPDEAKLVDLFSHPRALPLLNVRWEYREPKDGKSGGSEILVNYSHLGKAVGCEFPKMTPTYIDNLCRLGLAEVPAFLQYTALGIYDPLEQDDEIKAIQAQYENDQDRKVVFERKGLRVTELGKQFARICVLEKVQYLHAVGNLG